MKYRTLDDYYHWTCDWCDSENRTLWVRVAKGEVTCGACHRTNSDPSSTIAPQPLQRMMAGLC
ncbi:MAG: hypothetical protein WBI04_06890 [Trichlorobacter sp.]|jgi:hypothetical protein